jgi:ABC-type iron transport system FetAB ATPase subunit
MSGKLIVIEGPDGSGKSSVGKAVAEERGALLIEFPNNETATGPAIRSYLRKALRSQPKLKRTRGHPMSDKILDRVSLAQRLERGRTSSDDFDTLMAHDQALRKRVTELEKERDGLNHSIDRQGLELGDMLAVVDGLRTALTVERASRAEAVGLLRDAQAGAKMPATGDSSDSAVVEAVHILRFRAFLSRLATGDAT